MSVEYTLRQFCHRNRDGNHNTQADRMRSLALAARQLREAGFRQMKASSLKGKHVQALLDRWQGEGLSSGTIKNRLSHLRWWAEKIDKARELGAGLEKVTDPHVRMSLQLQAAFGLHRKESLLFQPRYADRGDHLALKGSWTKGGRERIVPITTPEQREVLQATHRLAGTGSLIPAHKNYIQQRHTYDGQCKVAGLSNMHGLRHRYAQMRYEALTGWAAPAAGGPPRHALSAEQREIDIYARQSISLELGHGRPQIIDVYCGR